MTLDAARAAMFANVALGHVSLPYPAKLDHVINGPGDLLSPEVLHPVFFGSFDWHSCVHGFWMLARIARLHPTLDVVPDIHALFSARLRPALVAGELAYLAQPNRGGFERPYGWAWLLMLQAELIRTDGAERWRDALEPLADAFVERWHGHLPRATYPVRAGTHANTAFATALSIEYARVAGNSKLEQALAEAARRWYGNDRNCQAWEPSGDDFLSPTLIEAECMRRCLSANEFSHWRDAFLPDLAKSEPANLFTPATVSDRTDGKIAHLDGFNFCRAWCWQALAHTWAADDPRRARALNAAARHLDAALPHVSGDYMGEHWLATFATLALGPG